MHGEKFGRENVILNNDVNYMYTSRKNLLCGFSGMINVNEYTNNPFVSITCVVTVNFSSIVWCIKNAERTTKRSLNMYYLHSCPKKLSVCIVSDEYFYEKNLGYA